MEKNTVVVKIEGLGEIEILLTDYQAKKLMQDGARAIKKEVESSSKKIGPAPVEGGFVGSREDWDRFFPGISMEEIQETIESALNREARTRKGIMAAAVILGFALTNALTGVSFFDVVKIIGKAFGIVPGGSAGTSED